MRYKKKWYDSYDWLKMMYIDKTLTISEIAESIGVSDETIRQLLMRHKLKRRK